MKTIKISLICVLTLAGCAEESAQVPLQVDTGAEARMDQRAAVALQPQHAPSQTVFEQRPASEVLTAKHSHLLALSEDEAAWLDRHGYPTAAELGALDTYDADELELAMRDRKDPKSAALLGHKRFLEGDLGGALAAFGRGAQLGSLYARQQGALVGTHRVTGLAMDELAQADQGNLGVMVAELEVARMLGDHRAQALIDRYATDFDWDHYGKHVLTQTAIFMDRYGEFAQARGERISGPDPRPNAQAWAALETDPNALVKVYTRGRPYP